ncbi:MAG: Holliday junction resolvase RuvX [Anaerolineae bacterium]
MSTMRRIMGIDYGERRIGVALSDPLGWIARPYRVITPESEDAGLALLGEIVRAESVVKVVVGLPTDSRSQIGDQARTVIRWARRLSRSIAVPVVFWDETYSSAAAEELAGKRAKRGRGRRPEPIDHIAAAAILQEYLDAGGAEYEPGQTLEAFAEIE